MPEDSISFHFHNDKPTPKIKSVAGKIVAAFEKNGAEVEELSYEQDGKKCYASFWPDFKDDASDIKEALGYLNGLSHIELPYAKIEMDSTGDVFYYLLDGQHLASFDDFKELKQHRDLVGKSSIEDALLRHVDENNILNGEGWQVLELLECLVLQEDIDKVTAKLYSPLQGSSASLFSLEDGIVCVPWREDEPLPPNIWPS